MAHDVFISYSSKDKPIADATCAALEAKGMRCWIAPRDILPGADWGEAIVDAINGARLFVLVFSENANDSVQIKREVERAINKALPVIPLRVENVMPTKSLEYFLSTPHWLDAYSPPLEKHLQYLADVSRSILDGGAAPHREDSVKPSVDRRVLLIGGAVSAVAALAIGFALLPKHSAPSFAGTWKAEKIEVPGDAPSPFAPFPVNAFYKAALESKALTAHLEINDIGAYSFAWGGEDRGRVTVDGSAVTFVSDINGKTTRMNYLIADPPPAGAVSALGGDAGDAALILSAPGTNAAVLLGTAHSPSGHWGTHTPSVGIFDATTTALDIGTDGRYRFHFEFAETGQFHADGAGWSRERPNVPPVTGTYKFDGPDRVTAASGGGVTIWVRDQ